MEKETRENLMETWPRWLSVGLSHLNGRKKRLCLYHVRKTFFILPASLLFCLTLLGCDEQKENSLGLPDSQSQNSSIGAKPESKHGIPRAENAEAVHLPRIVAFGDSLTAGLGVAPEDSYPGQLALWLTEHGFAYDVINAGVSGDTTAGGLRRVEWILKSQPKVVILELGANDGLRGHPLSETYKNLHTIIKVLKEKGVIVILAGMRLPLNYGEDYTRKFSDLFVRLAKEYDLPYVPFFLENVATHRSLNQGDGLHPNAEGYSIVVHNVWKTLEPVLTELAQEKYPSFSHKKEGY